MTFRKIIYGRKPCIVPFCMCTVAHTPNLGTEVICAKHWRLIGRQERRAYNDQKRALVAKIGSDSEPTNRDLFAEIAAVNSVWNKLKQHVIERAVGL